MLKILVAEDEADIRNLIKEQLEMLGDEVITAADGAEALKIITQEAPDMALLDIMMPRIDGLQLLKKIREKSHMPVIFVTARGEEYDRVLGLSQGADDYLVKPFSLAELSARVAVQKRHLERNMPEQPKQLVVGNLEIDFEAGTVKRSGETLVLNAKEYLILKYFVENRNKVLTKRQIYQAVWGEEYLFDDNTIMVQISHLRGKIEDNQFHYIQTLKGIGYRFTVEEQ